VCVCVCVGVGWRGTERRTSRANQSREPGLALLLDPDELKSSEVAELPRDRTSELMKQKLAKYSLAHTCMKA
jgi:hypothetical protein